MAIELAGINTNDLTLPTYAVAGDLLLLASQGQAVPGGGAIQEDDWLTVSVGIDVVGNVISALHAHTVTPEEDAANALAVPLNNHPGREELIMVWRGVAPLSAPQVSGSGCFEAVGDLHQPIMSVPPTQKMSEALVPISAGGLYLQVITDTVDTGSLTSTSLQLIGDYLTGSTSVAGHVLLSRAPVVPGQTASFAYDFTTHHFQTAVILRPKRRARGSMLV